MKVNNKSSRLICIQTEKGRVDLIPSEITEDYRLDSVKNEKVFQALIKAGDIEVVEEKSKAKEKAKEKAKSKAKEKDSDEEKSKTKKDLLIDEAEEIGIEKAKDMTIKQLEDAIEKAKEDAKNGENSEDKEKA